MIVAGPAPKKSELVPAKLAPGKKPMERVPPPREEVAQRMEDHKRALSHFGVIDLDGLAGC
jgi:hypothetical protein